MAVMKKKLAPILVLILPLAACALRPAWHWEKAGASPEDYKTDLNYCKSVSYPGADGNVNGEMVRRMQLCMQAHGWHRAAD